MIEIKTPISDEGIKPASAHRAILLILACLFALVSETAAAGFPIFRTDIAWGKYSAGLIDGNSFLAAGNFTAGDGSPRASFIGKWDLEGNRIWEKEITREWTDVFHSLRKNPDGTTLALGETFPHTDPAAIRSLLFLVLDSVGDTLSRSRVTIPSLWSQDSLGTDPLHHNPTAYRDFVAFQGRNFVLGRDELSRSPFIAELDGKFRHIRHTYLKTDEENMIASKLFVRNGKLVVLGGKGSYGPLSEPHRDDFRPILMSVGLDWKIDQVLIAEEFFGNTGYFSDGLMVGDRIIGSGPTILAQFGFNLAFEWIKKVRFHFPEPTAVRRDANGNLLVITKPPVVNHGAGSQLEIFNSQGDSLNQTSLGLDGRDFLIAPGENLIALGFMENSNLPSTTEEAAYILRIPYSSYLRPLITVKPHPFSHRSIGWEWRLKTPRSADALGRRSQSSLPIASMPLFKAP